MTWLRARGPWLRRALSVFAGWMLLMFVRVQSAAAAPIAAADKIGQTPPALAWIDLKDSRGISIWNFEMSLDRGGITSPDKFFWASITDACWGAYRSWCALSLWFLDWVLSFTWVQTIAAPLLSVGDAMQQVVTRLGLVPTFLTLTALLAGLWMLKGRHTTAIWEVGIACVIAALASGVFAQPVQMIAGQNGYIVKANQTGQELAAALATGDAEGKSPEQLRQAQTGQLVDTFIRQPTQMINFGQVLDGGKCEGAYNDVVKGGPYGNESDIRDKISDCDNTLGEYAANPSASMALGSIVFFPAAFVILAMCMLLGGSVIAAAVWAMFQSLKAIVTFVTGLLPGGGRGSLMLTAAETIVALLLIVFTSVFLSVFLLVIQALFAASKGESIPKTFVIVDILIIVGIFVYMRQRKQLKAAAQRLAQWMSQRPGELRRPACLSGHPAWVWAPRPRPSAPPPAWLSCELSARPPTGRPAPPSWTTVSRPRSSSPSRAATTAATARCPTSTSYRHRAPAGEGPVDRSCPAAPIAHICLRAAPASPLRLLPVATYPGSRGARRPPGPSCARAPTPRWRMPPVELRPR